MLISAPAIPQALVPFVAGGAPTQGEPAAATAGRGLGIELGTVTTTQASSLITTGIVREENAGIA